MSTFRHKNILGLLVLTGLLVPLLGTGPSAQMIVSGGQVTQIDVEVGPVFPIPTESGRDGYTTFHEALQPGAMFAVFVGTPEAVPLYVLHIGEVPPVEAPPVFIEIENLQLADLALFIQTQDLVARLDGRTGSGKGVAKKGSSDAVSAGATAESGSVRRRAGSTSGSGGSLRRRSAGSSGGGGAITRRRFAGGGPTRFRPGTDATDSAETAESGSIRRRADAGGSLRRRAAGSSGGTITRRRFAGGGPTRFRSGSGTGNGDLLLLSISGQIRLMHTDRGATDFDVFYEE